MYFDRFDICEAHYAFAADYHAGQGSDLYARLSRISRYFRPSPLFRGYDSLSENGKEIYAGLMERFEV